MKEIFFGKGISERVNETIKRTKKIKNQERKEKSINEMIRLFCSQSFFESKFIFFNEGLKHSYEMRQEAEKNPYSMLNIFYPKGKNYLLEELNNLVKNENEYELARKELIKLNVDVSDFPKKLNYLERLN